MTERTDKNDLSPVNGDNDVDSDRSCGSNAASSTTMGAGENSDEEASKSILKEQITKRETKVVLQLRLLVIIILLAAACAVSVLLFRITRASEIEEFESQYEGAAQKVVESFESIVRRMGAISGLGVAYSAQTADDDNQNWPYVTLNYFQQRAGNIRLLSGALMVSVSPVVMPGQIRQWEEYVNGPVSTWIHDSYAFQDKNGVNDFEDEDNIAKSVLSNKTVDPVHYFDEYGVSHPENKTGLFLPTWQQSPLLKTRYVNENVFSRPAMSDVLKRVVFREVAVLGRFMMAPAGNSSHPNPVTALLSTLQSIEEKQETPYLGDPCAHMYIPVFDHLNETKRTAVAVMSSIIHWRRYFMGILPNNIQGIRIVLENSCDGNYTYQLDGPEANVIGAGEQFNPTFANYRRDANFDVEFFEDGTSSGIEVSHEGCLYRIKVYPTQQFYDQYVTNFPILITCSIAVVFLFSMVMFGCYDRLVEQRQRIVLNKAMQSTAIVNSLFPKQVQERLMKGAQDALESALPSNKNRLKGFINDGNESKDLSMATIADLFPHCTVFFGDIAGFTAWASTRDPEQVFILLQNVYQAFDVLAKRRKVFKVETIGDCYMAVTGLPEPMDSHCITMIRFAWDAIEKMNVIAKELERTLGPDTGALSMRIGIHSGQVTAGVLRGDRARFQLFGDTVNTASRMESTGQPSKIHASEQVAVLLEKAGKGHWATKRKDVASVKGKGELQTYWVYPKSKRGSSVTSGDDAGISSSVSNESVQDGLALEKPMNHRLIDWMVDTILDDTKKLLFMYEQYGIEQTPLAPVYHAPEGKTCMDEVLPVIEMPKFHKKMTAPLTESSCSHMEIGDNVVESLRAFVTTISQSYRNNAFHNFEHACHVTMSVRKLLKRIVEPDISNSNREDIKDQKDLAAHLHDYTHGLHNDALAALAITFSALIHDVDHHGVSNTQLGIEFPELAEKYHQKSLAEQNSLDLSWDILMMPQFDDLRACLFPSEAELLRFRQLIVNIVLATDIFDKELNILRKSRWERAFAEPAISTEIPSGEEVVPEDDESQGSSPEKSDLRATIVLEHIIQASDVSHTMQHWQVYQKWNSCLFLELSAAYQAGRLAKDPAEFWYQGELGFFDNYVIPLAKKLDQCGVFGVSSDEYLHYAVQNRTEWEQRGKEIVKELIKTASTTTKKKTEKNKGEAQLTQEKEETA